MDVISGKYILPRTNAARDAGNGNRPIVANTRRCKKTEVVESAISEENFVGELISNLKNLPEDSLATLDLKPDYKLVEKVLEGAYDIAVARESISEVNKNEIGALIKNRIKLIEGCILYIGSTFDIDHGPYVLTLRSGLQIMLDHYKDFPVGGNETLGVEFNNSRIIKCVKVLDSSLRRWKDHIDILSYDNIVHLDEDLTLPKELPKSHIWWIYTLGTGDAGVKLAN